MSATDTADAIISSIANPFDDDSDHGSYASDEDGTPRWLQEARDALPTAPDARQHVAAEQNPFDMPAISSENPWAQQQPEAPPTVSASSPALVPTPRPAQLDDEHVETPTPPTSAAAGGAAGGAAAPPTGPAPVEVEPATFAPDMAHGCAALLASGRHADVSFELPARTLKAHRAILEARCGAGLVEALQSGALGEVAGTGESSTSRPAAAASDGGNGMLRIRLTSQTVGDPSGTSLAALLTYVYTERMCRKRCAT